MKRRSEPRVSRELPVRIFCVNPQGGILNKTVTTLDISRQGARISGVDALSQIGEIVGLSNGTHKSRYKVVWIGTPGTPEQGQVGLRCLESEKPLWGEEIVASPAPEAPAAAPEPVKLAPRQEQRRKDVRYSVDGGANVRTEGSQSDHWTRLHDLSLNGCYMWTTAPLPAGTPLNLSIYVGDLQIHTAGVVSTVDRAVGMGVKFTVMTKANRDRLNELVSKLQAEGQAAPPSRRR